MAKKSSSPCDVREWLAKQGYPLEMAVAGAFRAAGFEVAQSTFYTDPETDKPREIDVVASKDRMDEESWLRVTFVLECKSGKDHPWVLLGRPTRPLDGISRLAAVLTSKSGGVVAAYLRRRSKVPLAPLLSRSLLPAYGAVRACGGNEDVPYGALMSVVKASISQVERSNAEDDEYGPLAELVFPAIVVDAPTYDYRLDDTNVPRLERIEGGAIGWQVPPLGRRSTIVDIVTHLQVAQYAKEALEVAEMILAQSDEPMKRLVEQAQRKRDNR
jgi:hypothetical protein